MKGTLTVFAAGVIVGAGLGVPVGPAIIHAAADPAPVVAEDDAGWDCRTQGNRVCGPSNAQGVAAGRYEAGVLVVPWEQLR